jgi:hypothetical protein
MISQAGDIRMDIQLAKSRCKLLVLLWLNPLLSEEDDTVLKKRLMHLLKGAVIHRLGELDTVHLGTNCTGDRRHTYVRILH